MRRNHFEVTLGLCMRMTYVDNGLLPRLAIDLSHHFSVHHRVQSIFTENTVSVGTACPLDSHR